MKKRLLIVVLVLMTISSYAQMDFSQMSYTLIWHCNYEPNDTSFYSFEDSTSVGEKTYWRVPSAYPSLWIRQEGSVVYALDTLNMKDLKLYDFSLGVGDSLWTIVPVFYREASIHSYDYTYNHTKEECDTVLVVDSVGTMLLCNGDSARVWYFDHLSIPVVYPVVEGIGYFGGIENIIRYPQPTNGSYYELQSLYVGDELIYHSGGCDSTMDYNQPASSLSSPMHSTCPTKTIDNDQIIIIRDGAKYNVVGVKY